MTKISIVTPSYNQGPYVAEMLYSVSSQNYLNLEHLVLDGASTDDTLSVLRSQADPNLHWSSRPDHGQSDALNRGFRLATGDIIGWLNADDRYRPGSLHTIAKIFAANPQIDILYGDYTVIDEYGRHLRTRREIEFSRLILFHHPTLCIPTPSTFFRRRIFDEGNFLDEQLHYAMDHEFFARLATRGYRFKHVSHILADFRIHPESKSSLLPRQQIAESRATMLTYSPVASRLHSPTLRSIAFTTMRCLAAASRYSEKLLRGYYLPRHHTLPSPTSNQAGKP